MKIFLILALIICFAACDRVKQKTSTAVNKTGEAVGKGSSGFINSVSEGISKTFNSTVSLSDALEAKGLEVGKFTIDSKDSLDHNNNVLTLYFIFNQDINQNIMIKLLDDDGKEYGRISQLLSGIKGEAKYVDFLFDRRVDIEEQSTFVVE